MTWKYNDLLESLKNRFNKLEEAVIEEIPEEDIIKMSYEIMNFIEFNGITPEEELKALEEVGAAHPMSVLLEWYEDTQYRLNRKEVI